MKEIYKMTVIPEPEEGTRTVLWNNSAGPIFEGDGPRTYQCGKCGKTLAKTIHPMQITGAIIKCGQCDVCNMIPIGHQSH